MRPGGELRDAGQDLGVLGPREAPPKDGRLQGGRHGEDMREPVGDVLVLWGILSVCDSMRYIDGDERKEKKEEAHRGGVGL
jgi:hypothetical protein